MVTCSKKTNDDWHNNWVDACGVSGKSVMVKYHGNISPTMGTACYRVSVFGTDDYGFVFDATTSKEAIDVFNIIVALPLVNIDVVKQLGFEIF